MDELAQAVMQRDGALQQLEFARRYTLELLGAVPHDLWLTVPTGAPSHLLWQAGHLAVAEYGLLLFRFRGRMPEDLEWIPGPFRKGYGRGSKPSMDPQQLKPPEMLDRLQAIHDAGMVAVRAAPPERLLEPVEMPYAGPANVLGSLLFAPLHEMLHAGQIGLIRRLLGLEPVR